MSSDKGGSSSSSKGAASGGAAGASGGAAGAATTSSSSDGKKHLVKKLTENLLHTYKEINRVSVLGSQQQQCLCSSLLFPLRSPTTPPCRGTVPQKYYEKKRRKAAEAAASGSR